MDFLYAGVWVGRGVFIVAVVVLTEGRVAERLIEFDLSRVVRVWLPVCTGGRSSRCALESIAVTVTVLTFDPTAVGIEGIVERIRGARIDIRRAQFEGRENLLVGHLEEVREVSQPWLDRQDVVNIAVVAVLTIGPVHVREAG